MANKRKVNLSMYSSLKKHRTLCMKGIRQGVRKRVTCNSIKKSDAELSRYEHKVNADKEFHTNMEESEFSFTGSTITKSKRLNLSAQTGAQRDKQNQPHFLHEEGNISRSGEISHTVFIFERQSKHHLMLNQRTAHVKNGRVNRRKLSYNRFRKSENHVCEVCRKVFSSFMVLRLHLACHIHGNLLKPNQEKFGSAQQKNSTVNKMIKSLALGIRKRKDLRAIEKFAGSKSCEAHVADNGTKDKASLGMSEDDDGMVELPISDTNATDSGCGGNTFELCTPEDYCKSNSCSSQLNVVRFDSTGISHDMVCDQSEQTAVSEPDPSSVTVDTQSDTLNWQEIRTTVELKEIKTACMRRKQITQREAEQLNASAMDFDAVLQENNRMDAEVNMSTQSTCNSLSVSRPGLDQNLQNCDVNSDSRKPLAMPHQESRPNIENSEKGSAMSDGHACRKRLLGGVSSKCADKRIKKSSLKCLFCDVKCESRKILHAHMRSNHSGESKLCPNNSSRKTPVQHHTKDCHLRITGSAGSQGTAASEIDYGVDDSASVEDCKPMSQKNKLAVIDNALKSLLLPLESRLKSSYRQNGSSDEVGENLVNGGNDAQQDKESDNSVGKKNGVTSQTTLNVDIGEQRCSYIDILGPYMETYTGDELQSIKPDASL